MRLFKKRPVGRETAGKRSIPFKKIIFILILILMLGGASYFGVQFLEKKEILSVKTFEHVQIKPEVIAFTFEKLPKLYDDLLAMNHEISLIDREIQRMDKIEKDFPAQKKIVTSEKKIWQQTRQNLLEALNRSGENIEALYVAWQVNPRKGLQIIEDRRDELSSAMDDSLKTAGNLTRRLAPSSGETTAWEQIKEKMLSLKKRFLK
jgi:hypothetical protein